MSSFKTRLLKAHNMVAERYYDMVFTYQDEAMEADPEANAAWGELNNRFDAMHEAGEIKPAAIFMPDWKNERERQWNWYLRTDQRARELVPVVWASMLRYVETIGGLHAPRKTGGKP